MVLGLGVPELIFIAVVVGIFLFGAPKVKEWVDTFKSQKKAAVDIIKSDPDSALVKEEEYIPIKKVPKLAVKKKVVAKENTEEMEFP